MRLQSGLHLHAWVADFQPLYAVLSGPRAVDSHKEVEDIEGYMSTNMAGITAMGYHFLWGI